MQINFLFDFVCSLRSQTAISFSAHCSYDFFTQIITKEFNIQFKSKHQSFSVFILHNENEYLMEQIELIWCIFHLILFKYFALQSNKIKLIWIWNTILIDRFALNFYRADISKTLTMNIRIQMRMIMMKMTMRKKMHLYRIWR